MDGPIAPQRETIISMSSVLSEFELEIIRLIYRDGLTQGEAADALECGLRTVERYHRDIMDKLAEYNSLEIDF